MRVFACGRLTLYPRRSFERFLARGEGRLVRRLQDADLVVVGAAAAAWPRDKLEPTIERADRLGLPVLGERAALRRLGILPALADEARPYSLDELARRSGLSTAELRLLVLFDVIEGEEGRFGFRAMKAAKAAGQLLGNVPLGDLVAACHRVRSAFDIAEPLSELQLTSDHGRVVLSAGGRIAELDGQLRLELQLPRADIDALVTSAEEARAAGDESGAERTLRQALAAAPKDADALFELGSLLCERGEFSEGMALLKKATRQHPGFADAWYNLGHAFEAQRRIGEAKDAYERAAEADPTYADPLFNLGMLSLEDAAYPEAIALLERYLTLDPSSEWSDRARKATTLARLTLMQAGSRSPDGAKRNPG
jgi:tetratricopeptide (TPR) repeat protein